MTDTEQSAITKSLTSFRARYQHPLWGIALAAIGGVMVLVAFTNFGAGDASGIIDLFFGAAFIAWSVFLLRGRGVNPKIAERKAAAAQRRADAAAAAAQRQAANAAAGMSTAQTALVAAVGAGASLVAYRNLQETAKKWHPTDASEQVKQVLTEIEFDMSTINSRRYGYVPAVGGGSVELFEDYIVYGQEAHDVDMVTRGQVYTDGSVQVTSNVVTDKKGRQRVVQQQHDMRTATMQFTGSTWSMSVPIDPDQVNSARAYVQQVNSHAESLRPQAATSTEIKIMVDAIINNSGQPAAEKIRQLDHLRYERLLNDTEFQKAKDNILGL